MGLLDSITDTVSDAVNSVVDTAESVAKGVESMGEDAVSGVGDFFSKGLPSFSEFAFDVLKGTGESLFNDLVHDVTHPADFVSDVGDAIKNTASDAADGIKDFVEGLPRDAEMVWDIFNYATDNVPNDLIHVITHPKEAISTVSDAL